MPAFKDFRPGQAVEVPSGAIKQGDKTPFKNLTGHVLVTKIEDDEKGNNAFIPGLHEWVHVDPQTYIHPGVKV